MSSQIDIVKHRIALLRAVATGSSPMLTIAPVLLESTYVSSDVILPAACGDRVKNEVPRQPAPLSTRVSMAMALGDHFKLVNGVDEDMARAHGWGQLLATWAGSGGESITTARQCLARLCEVLSDEAVRKGYVKKWCHALFNMLRTSKGSVNTTLMEHIHPAYRSLDRDYVTEQSYLMFQTLAHSIRFKAVFNMNEEWLDALDSIKLCDARLVTLPDNPELKDGWETTVRAWTVDQVVALYSIPWHTHRSERATYYVSGITALVVGICKPAGGTAEWFNSRIGRIITAMKGINLDGLDASSISKFSSLFLTPAPPADRLYKILMAAYATLKDTQMESISWIIEQAASRNATHAMLVGQAYKVTQGRYLSLIWRFLPITEKKAIARLAGYLSNDKWGCLTAPYLPAKDYATLANVAVRVMARMQKSVDRYRHKILDGGSLQASQVEALATEIVGMTNVAQDELVSLANQVKEACPGVDIYYDDTTVILHTDERHTIDSATLARVARPIEEIPGAEGGLPTNKVPTVEDLSSDGTRVSWPKPARRLPTNAIKTSHEHLQKILMSQLRAAPDFKALETILEALAEMGNQQPLEPFGSDFKATAPSSRFKGVSTELLSAIKVFIPDFNIQTPLDDNVGIRDIQQSEQRFLYKAPVIALEIRAPPAEGAAGAPTTGAALDDDNDLDNLPYFDNITD